MSEIQVETTLISKNKNFLVRTYILLFFFFWKTCTVLNCNCKSVNLPILIVTNCYLITKKIAKLNFFKVFFRRNQFLERFFVIGNKIFVGMRDQGGLREEFSIFFFVFFSQNRLRDTNIYQMHQIKNDQTQFWLQF